MELRIGMLVKDRWWPWNVGKIVAITDYPKRWVVLFCDGKEARYDKDHIQFLESGE